MIPQLGERDVPRMPCVVRLAGGTGEPRAVLDWHDGAEDLRLMPPHLAEEDLEPVVADRRHVGIQEEEMRDRGLPGPPIQRLTPQAVPVETQQTGRDRADLGLWAQRDQVRQRNAG